MNSPPDVATPGSSGAFHPAWFSLVALLGVTLALEIYLWWGKFQYSHDSYRKATIGFSIFVVLLSHWKRQDSFREMGVRIDNVARVIRVYGGPTLALAAGIVILGTWTGQLVPVTLLGAASYLGWATVQQHLLQNFFRPRLQEVVGLFGGSPVVASRSAVLLAATLFSLLHWPNHLLTLLTFSGGLLWCGLFVRVPSLWGATLSQTTLTILLMWFFKFGALDHFQVGAPGKRFEYFGEGVRVAAGYDAARKPMIGTLPGPDHGQSSQLRLFDASGQLKREWVAFPEYDFSGEVAIGELDAAPGDEIAVAPGPGYQNPPLVRIFDNSGDLVREVVFSQLPSRYGAWVSIACRRLYVGAGPGPASPQILLEVSSDGVVRRHWTFDNLPFENGLRGTALCPPAGEQSEPEQLLLWGSDISTNPSTIFYFRTDTGEMKAVPNLNTTFGAQLTLLDRLNSPPLLAISPGPLHGYPGIVRLQTLSGELVRHFVFDENPDRFGNSLAALDLDGDGNDELVIGEGTGPGRGFEVQLRSTDGDLIRAWSAYSKGTEHELLVPRTRP